jgi:glucans biosynthesis protein C
MWFVELILVFSFAYAVYKYFFPQGIWQLRNSEFPTNRSILIFIIALGIASFISRVIFPMGGGYMAARPLASLVLFSTSFFIGTIAWKYQWLDKLSDKSAWLWFWVALTVMVVPLILFVILRKQVSFASIKGAGSLASLIYSYWEVIKCIGTGMISIVVFRKYFDKQGKIAAAMGRSAFAAYVLHPLVCVLLMFLMAGIHIHPLMKFAIVAPASIVATFSVSWLFIQIPGINKIF